MTTHTQKTRRIRNSALAAGLIAMTGLLLTATALASQEAEQARALVEGGDVLPLEQLITRARQHKPGTLIEAELDWKPERGMTVYELLMLGEDGQLWELEFDARSGELLEVEREDD